MASPSSQPSQEAHLNSAQTPPTKQPFTIAPSGNFFFVEDNKKSTIVAIGKTKPNVAESIVKEAKEAKPDRLDKNLAQVTSVALAAHGSLQTKDSEADASAFKKMLNKNVDGMCRAHSHAIRAKPYLKSPVAAVITLSTATVGLAATIWFNGGREILGQPVDAPEKSSEQPTNFSLRH